MKSSRTFINHPDNFCYTRGMYMVKYEQRERDEFYKNACRACFRIQLGDQDKQWAAHFICKYCKEN